MTKLGAPAKDLIPDGLQRVDAVRKRAGLKKLVIPNKRRPEDIPETEALKPDEARFIWLIAEKGLTPGAAWAEASGTSAQNGYKVLKKPNVQKALIEAREKWAQASKMTRQRVIDGFLDSINLAKMAGEPIAMVAAWREIARMCGFYEPTRHKVEISVNGQLQLERLQTIPREQLLKLAEGDALEGDFVEISGITGPQGSSAGPEGPRDELLGAKLDAGTG